MQGQKRDSVINSFPYPKTLGVSQISVCSLQYDTDGMLTLKTSTDQVLQSPSADSRENGSKDAPRACSRCRARSSVQPRVYTAANSRGALAHLTLVFSPSALSKQEKDHTQVGCWDQVWQAALVHGHVGVLMSDPPRQKMSGKFLFPRLKIKWGFGDTKPRRPTANPTSWLHSGNPQWIHYHSIQHLALLHTRAHFQNATSKGLAPLAPGC